MNSGKIWFVYPSTSQYPIRGIDVSNHQGKIDWTLVPKSEISFVYIKATEGRDFKDKSFHLNWKKAKANGFLLVLIISLPYANLEKNKRKILFPRFRKK
ncbi:glycosyl hydrolase family 25 domain protein [Leptospira interrogans serovar Pyrogenes str. 2006006960]|nr:glycosyl hydrolase family 25 domain protein [Leptospira interrogans serovar Pyrogenes str. 2006006960]